MPVRVASLVLAMLPMAAGAVELIGKTMPPYPPGLRDIGGSCLSDSADPAHVCDFSIGLLADADTDPDAEPVPRYVVAGRMAGREGPLALWKITDAQTYPKVEKGYFWQAGSCRVDKVDDAKIIAVVRQGTEEEYLTDVAWARRLDLKSGKFSVLDPAHVDCVNEGYGEP
ncbi:hypothetical protein [Pseudoxanthomonas sp. CF125]|uniref:hypothetical protein n=1 Tax=Pseudoxanthomonas sp. CF125 TaxID=1855303 RepID=UPI00088B2342|nr:hypothetical protein [Pseudoxanthomonas sp. CF125]SDQ54862.1 hypothetical protein SAMN05216569_1536 [Pseudoxanthomonas sp. CF125]